MASLPPGFELESPAQPNAAISLPPGFELEASAPKTAPEPVAEQPIPESTNPLMAAAKAVGNVSTAPYRALSKFVTGSDRATEQTENLPELHESGLLSDQNQAKVAAIAPALLTAYDPNEIANIITSNFEDVGLTYNKDGEGNAIPVLVNNKTGAATIINRPGISGMDVLQTIGLGAAFTPAGRGATGLTALAAKGAGTQAGIEGVQALSGGEFNTSDVALAGGAMPAGQVLADKVIAPAVKAGGQQLVKAVTQQSPAKQRMKTLLEAGVPENELAKFTLKGNKVVKDGEATRVLRQGFDEGIVATAKAGSIADKRAFKKMLDTAEKGTKNTRFAAENRPTDAVGKSISKGFATVKEVNKEAGKRIDQVANKQLKGATVDYDKPVQNFLDDLTEMGVTIDNGKPSFKGSDIEGLGTGQRVIRQLATRLNNAEKTDAYGVHRMKRYIDELVTYGKQSEGGLSNEVQRSVKNLRAGLDDTLDTAFPDYNQANIQYKDTIEALDSFKKIAGKGFDVNSDRAVQQAGTLSRRLLSNAQRGPLMESLESLQRVSGKYGKKFDDDIISQVMFADELERMFGSQARTSLQGEVRKGVSRATQGKEGLYQVGVDKAGELLEKGRGINNKNAFQSMRKLLERELNDS